MWSVNVRLLRGVYVATDTGHWDKSEWPPHPARLFMAMAAAYYETREPPRRPQPEDDLPAADRLREALQWLEQQPAPRILATEAAEREPVTVFVPVNDSTKADQLFANTRSRQPRHFPTRVPRGEVVHYVYDGVVDSDVAQALDSIAGEVTRIGHSSSLAQVWIETDFSFPEGEVESANLIAWSPEKGGHSDAVPMRSCLPGMLSSLESRYNEAAIEEHAALQRSLAESKGKRKAEIRTRLEERFPDGPPVSLRPQAAVVTPYRKKSPTLHEPAHSCFDADMMVLAFQEAPVIGLESTLQLAGAVRKRIHDAFPDRTSPEWLGGHRPDGAPSADPHLASIPLPFVGYQHADGHLLGIGLVFPRAVSIRDRAVTLRRLFERSASTSDWTLRLHLHRFRRLTGEDAALGVSLTREQRLTPPRALSNHTWTAVSTVWESVTPIVLDRFPKRDRRSEREAWKEEIADIISASCENVGLPRPHAVHVHHNSFVLGALSARPQGGGFPLMKSRDGKPSRYQVHARLEFGTPVRGPVLLGAGRFVGYGFCRPNLQRCRQRRDV